MSWGSPIEGETPLDNRDGLRDKSILTREQLNAAEARNIAVVVAKYLASKPRRRSAKFDFPWLLRLHKQMFGDVWKWAGKVRTTNVNIGVHCNLIVEHLGQMVSDVEYRETEWEMLEQAVYMHHRSVQIHPFHNGNSRWFRILANIWLRLHDHPVIDWPGEIGVDTSIIRNEYIACVRAADGGQFDQLVALHRRFLRQSSTILGDPLLAAHLTLLGPFVSLTRHGSVRRADVHFGSGLREARCNRNGARSHAHHRRRDGS